MFIWRIKKQINENKKETNETILKEKEDRLKRIEEHYAELIELTKKNILVKGECDSRRQLIEEKFKLSLTNQFGNFLFPKNSKFINYN